MLPSLTSEQSWILGSHGGRVLTSDNCAFPAAHARARALSHQNAPRAEGKEIGKQASESVINQEAIDTCKTSSAFRKVPPHLVFPVCSRIIWILATAANLFFFPFPVKLRLLLGLSSYPSLLLVLRGHFEFYFIK